MSRSAIRLYGLAATGLVALAMGGCPLTGELPDEFDVAIRSTEERPAARDTGPTALADSLWDAFRAAPPAGSEPAAEATAPPPGPYGGLLDGGLLARPAPGEQMFSVQFGERGEMTRIGGNRFFLPDIYGAELPIGGGWLSSRLPGVTFRSASYGLTVNDRFGVAVLVQVRLGALYVGRAIIYAWGTATPDRIDGTFGYLLDFSGGIGELLLGTTGDQYRFFATPAE